MAVGLEGFERRHIGSLSAGQFQRVLFARLLLQDAEVIILDEPFTAIDARTTRDLLEIVRTWHHDGRTVIAVLHDLDLVRANFPQTLLLAREAIDWGATEVALSSTNLLRTRAVAENWNEDAPVCEPRSRYAYDSLFSLGLSFRRIWIHAPRAHSVDRAWPWIGPGRRPIDAATR